MFFCAHRATRAAVALDLSTVPQTDSDEATAVGSHDRSEVVAVLSHPTVLLRHLASVLGTFRLADVDEVLNALLPALLQLTPIHTDQLGAGTEPVELDAEDHVGLRTSLVLGAGAEDRGVLATVEADARMGLLAGLVQIRQVATKSEQKMRRVLVGDLFDPLVSLRELADAQMDVERFFVVAAHHVVLDRDVTDHLDVLRTGRVGLDLTPCLEDVESWIEQHREAK